MTGPRPSRTRCARAGSRCRRTEVLRTAGPPAASTPEELAGRLVAEAATVQGEIDEIELLISQAKTEAARHETRRQSAADKLAQAAERLPSAPGSTASSEEVAHLPNHLVNGARKAALMEAQIHPPEGKRKPPGRPPASILRPAQNVRGLAGI